MENQITGNQWKVVKTDAEATYNANPFDVFASDHQCIAHVTNWNPEANAKLIAAAPEMLEALKEMNAWVAVNFPEHGMKHEFGTCASFNKMRSAIQKATK